MYSGSVRSGRTLVIGLVFGGALVVGAGACADRAPKKSAAGGGASGFCATTRPPGMARDLDVARCLSSPLSNRPTAPQAHSVVLYLDHSGSIQGFLDPNFPTTPTSFRSVIDKLIVGLTPALAYAYGSSLQKFPPTLGVIGNKSFYSDHDTRMEDALRLVEADTQLSSNHVIVGDGRRGDPNAADGQFTTMREAALKWVDHGGTFAVAASMIPFKTVATDPSGCRAPSVVDQQCPLYAFAFIANGDELRILGALGLVFENLYAWPAAPIPGAALSVQATAPAAGLNFNPVWAQASDSTPIARTQGPKPTTSRIKASVRVADEPGEVLSLYRKLLVGDGTRSQLQAKSLDVASRASAWSPIDNSGSVIAREPDPASVSITTHGENSPKSIVRFDLMPAGEPTWLSSFDAKDAKELLRTYGLGRLFEGFRQRALSDTTPMARVYFVVN